MDEKDSERALDALGARLKKARVAQMGPAHGRPKMQPETSSIGQALRVGMEMVSALVVGVSLGWFLDDLFDTKPVMLIVFIFMGGAAGILNVYRAAMQMSGPSKNKGEDGPSDAPESGSGENQREN